MAKTKTLTLDTTPSTLDTAKQALATFRTLCPDLSTFATVLAGRDPESTRGPNARLTVVPGPSTATDGTTIFIRPDARLAGTPTDTEWSQIKAGLFHEVAHVVFDSFRATSDTERAGALRTVTDRMDDSLRRDALLRLLDAAGDSYMALARVWHPHFPMLLNALEDARVEACLFLAKPGTHKHLAASRTAIFDAPKDEIEALIGKAWIDRDSDAQAIIGCYLVGAGYDPEGRLAEDVCVALRKVQSTILAATTSATMQDVYAAAFGVLSSLQALGFLRTGTEADEPMGETAHPEGGEASGEAGGGGDTTGCPHPKARIVPCAAPGCSGNCTLCGTHIVAAPKAGEAGEGKGEAGSKPEGKAGEKGEKGEDGPGDEAEAKGASGAAEGTSESSAGGAEGPRTAAETEALLAADDGSANVGDEAKDAPVERGTDEAGEDGTDEAATDEDAAAVAEALAKAEADLHDALHAAGGHDADLAEGRLADDDLDRALDLEDLGYGDEDLVACIGKIEVHDSRHPSRYMMTDTRFAVDVPEAERAIATVLPEMRKALALNGRTGFTPHQRSGRVDVRNLYRAATGETRVFGRFSTPETRDYLFVIALDCSGSMGGGGVYGKWATQKALAYAAGEMLNRLGVPFLMFGYSGSGGGPDKGMTVTIQDVRGENEPWDSAAKDRLSRLDAYAANLDGSTMQYARIRGRNACRNPRTEVVVIYMNDGGMPAENPVAEKRQIEREVREASRHNVRFVGVGLNSDAAGRAGLELVECHSVMDVRKITAKIAETMGVRV